VPTATSYLTGREIELATRMKRRFRIVLVHKTGQVLGTVEATDAHAAETVAAIQFELDEQQRRRLLMRAGLRRSPMDETEEAQKAAVAKGELAEILERRPDLNGKSVEAVRRILRREARLSLRPQRTSKTRE
jgi:hypothetical protein